MKLLLSICAVIGQGSSLDAPQRDFACNVECYK